MNDKYQNENITGCFTVKILLGSMIQFNRPNIFQISQLLCVLNVIEWLEGVGGPK